MSLSLAIRSLLVLLLCVIVASVAITYASVPPRSAIQAALQDQGTNGVTLPTAAAQAPSATAVPTRQASQSATPTPAPTATPSPVAIPRGLDVSSFPDVSGHIFFTTPSHNLSFITGRAVHKQITNDGASVAPALSPDSSMLAWVLFKRNYSDINVTTLRLGRDGSVRPLTTTVLTQDQSPPPALQLSPAPPGYDPRYEWWANKPAWLPDGQHLIYVSDRPGFDPTNQVNVTTSVWEQGLTDPVTNAVRLSTPRSGVAWHDSPAWRPGDPSTFIYVNYSRTGAQNTIDQGIIEAVTALTGTQPLTAPIDLTPQGIVQYHPAWSPDGRYIAFVEDKGTNTRSDLMVMPFRAPGYLADYNNVVTVAVGDAFAVQPFWSPDGRYLGYLSGGSGDFNMVIRRVYHERNGRLSFGPPIALPQAGAVSADYRPTWGK